MIGPLELLTDAVRRNDPAAQFFFVGDYVNRGTDCRRTLDFLLDLPNARFVRGNHDDIFDLVLHGSCYANSAAEGDRLRAFLWFMDHGLDDTFLSYGARVTQLQAAKQNASLDRLLELVELVPPAHRQFVRGLPALIEEDDLFVAHAKWGVNDPSELPSLGVQLATRPGLRHRILWGRYTSAEVHSPKTWERVGYFGHTPVTHYLSARASRDLVPIKGPNIVIVDTAAALFTEGRLTAFCADTQQYAQADRFGKTYLSDSSNGR
jgi:hypothetical protein